MSHDVTTRLKELAAGTREEGEREKQIVLRTRREWNFPLGLGLAVGAAGREQDLRIPSCAVSKAQS